MDCHALDIPDDSFDVTGSQFGVMLVPDQARALREMVRVTKPGGRVILIAYGHPAELEFLQFFVAAMKAVAPSSRAFPTIRRRSSSRSPTRRSCASGSTDAGLTTSASSGRPSGRPSPPGRRCGTGLLRKPDRRGWSSGTLGRAADDPPVLDGMLRERAGAERASVITNPVHIGIGTK